MTVITYDIGNDDLTLVSSVTNWMPSTKYGCVCVYNAGTHQIRSMNKKCTSSTTVHLLILDKQPTFSVLLRQSRSGNLYEDSSS